MRPTTIPAAPRLIRFIALMLLGTLLVGVGLPAFAASGGERSWGAFLGRLHVVVLHLPIGLLIGAFAIEFFGLFRRSRGFDIAAAWLFVMGAVTAIIATATGLLYGTEWAADNAGTEPMTVLQLLTADSIEEGVTETMGWHMWLGITLTVAAIVAAVLKVMAVRRQWVEDSSVPERGGWRLGVARVALVGTMAALPFAGHLGGNMTHGPEKLFERAPFEVADAIIYWPEQVEAKPVVAGGGEADPANAEVNGTVAFWNANIQPVLNDHCTACHNAGKQNGKLRLDTLELTMKGGSIGPSIEPGEARYSELYVRVSLPESHDEFMPTNIKKYGKMTPDEVLMLGEWIQAWDGELSDGSVAEAGERPIRPTTEEPEPEPAKPVIDPAALAAITEAGGNAQSLSQEQDPGLLTVKFAYLKSLDPATVAKLESGADAVAWMTFEGSSFGDDAAEQLPEMPKLTRLNLKDTEITDAGLGMLPEMPSLEWLNLFGTAVTDQGLAALERFDTLDKLYLTGTKVSAAGVETLRNALPDTQIYSDHDGQFQFAPVTPDVTPGDPAEDDKSSASVSASPAPAAKPVNDKCPVTGAAINAGFVSTFEGKTVGFCCGGCKGKFDADPAKFAGKLPQ